MDMKMVEATRKEIGHRDDARQEEAAQGLAITNNGQAPGVRDCA